MKDFLANDLPALVEQVNGKPACLCNPFSKNTQSSDVANQQVGVQGGGVGISGAPINASQGGTVNFVTSDAETVKAALDFSGDVALASVNSANQNTMAALLTLERQQDRNSALVTSAVNAAQDIALTATPRSEGAAIEAFQSQQNKLVMGIVGIVIVGGVIVYFKSK